MNESRLSISFVYAVTLHLHYFIIVFLNIALLPILVGGFITYFDVNLGFGTFYHFEENYTIFTVFYF